MVARLAEFAALPGLAQQAVAYRAPRVAEGAGHACGHHLFCAGSLAAGVDFFDVRCVGPCLGEGNIYRGFVSVMLGFGLVLVLMVVYLIILCLLLMVLFLYQKKIQKLME